MGVVASLCIAASAVAELCLKTAQRLLPTKSRAVCESTFHPHDRAIGSRVTRRFCVNPEATLTTTAFMRTYALIDLISDHSCTPYHLQARSWFFPHADDHRTLAGICLVKDHPFPDIVFFGRRDRALERASEGVLIDTSALAKEAKTEEERKAQAYGTDEPNPSVISLNAVSAAHAVNDFLLDYLSLRPESEIIHYEHFHFLNGKRALVEPRRNADCTECSPTGLRFGRGDAVELPSIDG